VKKKIWAVVAVAAMAMVTLVVSTTVGASPASAAVLQCNVTSENPHVSKGANSVIFKTRITCNIAAAITFRGTLAKGPLIGPGLPVASTVQSRAQIAGKTYTYYTPDQGESTVKCVSTAYYGGAVSVVGTAVNGVTDATSLATYHVKAC
jgi:hypothetical protein